MTDLRAVVRPAVLRPRVRAAALALALAAGLAPGAATAGTPESQPDDLTNAGGILVFSASDAVAGTEPWRSNGTSGGTTQLKDIGAGATSSSPRDTVAMGGRAYFHANGPTGRELWRTDGTPAGTRIVKDLRGAADGNVDDLVRAGSRLFF